MSADRYSGGRPRAFLFEKCHQAETGFTPPLTEAFFMNNEQLRTNLISHLGLDPEVVGNRELRVTPSFHEYNDKEVTSVVISFVGTPPRGRINIDNIGYCWKQRDVRLNGRSIPVGRRREILCALVEMYLSAQGYSVHERTALPLDYKVA